jgi:hypothetical protein
MSQNTEISTPVEKSLSNLMENNYLFDKSFNKKVTNEPDYNTFIKPIGGLGPKQVNVSTPEPEEVEDNYPEVLKNTNTNSEANPIFAHMNQQPQMFPGFPQQGFPQQGFQLPQCRLGKYPLGVQAPGRKPRCGVPHGSARSKWKLHRWYRARLFNPYLQRPQQRKSPQLLAQQPIPQHLGGKQYRQF